MSQVCIALLLNDFRIHMRVNLSVFLDICVLLHNVVLLQNAVLLYTCCHGFGIWTLFFTPLIAFEC